MEKNNQIDLYIVKNSLIENPSIKKEVHKNENLVNDIRVKHISYKDILNGNSNYTLIINSLDNLQDGFIKNSYKLAKENKGMIISSSPNENFQIQGKIFETIKLQKFIINENINKLDKFEFYKFILSNELSEQKNDKYMRIDNEVIKYFRHQICLKRHIKKYFEKLDELKEYLENKGIDITNSPFKEIYLEEISNKYWDINMSLNVSSISKDVILGALCFIVEKYFGETKEFEAKIKAKTLKSESDISDNCENIKCLKGKNPKVLKQIIEYII